MRRTWVRRIQPWLGAALFALGGFIGLLALSRGNLKAAAPALVAVGGATLIGGSTHGARRWTFLLGAIALAVLLYAAVENAPAP